MCGWIYDEAEGYEEEDIAPGTSWEDVPEDFVCPECGVGKEISQTRIKGMYVL